MPDPQLYKGHTRDPVFTLNKAFFARPTISMFFGIIIRMYYIPGEHPPPHFHAYYNEYRATIDLRTCEMMNGHLPNKQTKLVLAWAELHKDELMANWHLLMNGEEPFKIPPLH